MEFQASRTKAGYFPGAGEITVKVLAERGSGRLLGGQIVGVEGSAKRIDTLATVLHAGFTVKEMINLDLGCVPPFSPVWDPVALPVKQQRSISKMRTGFSRKGGINLQFSGYGY